MTCDKWLQGSAAVDGIATIIPIALLVLNLTSTRIFHLPNIIPKYRTPSPLRGSFCQIEVPWSLVLATSSSDMPFQVGHGVSCSILYLAQFGLQYIGIVTFPSLFRMYAV